MRNQLLTKGFMKRTVEKATGRKNLRFPWDAFGNSANMPQVYKLSGVDAVGGENTVYALTISGWALMEQNYLVLPVIQ